MTHQQRAQEIQDLRYRYRIARRHHKWKTAEMIFHRLRELTLRQLRYEARHDR